MGIFTYTNSFDTTSSNNLFDPTSTIQTRTASTYSFLTPGGTLTTLTSATNNFTYNGSNVPTGGTITSFTSTNGGVTRLTGTGLSASLADFYAAVFASAQPSTAAAGGFRVLATGADGMTGGSQDDVFSGGLGNDTINGGDGLDFIAPGPGVDSVNGGPGNDWLNYQDATTANYPTLSAPTGLTMTLGANGSGTVVDPWGFTDTYSGIERVRGTMQVDVITGNAADNAFQGLAGADTINGAGGGSDIANYNADSILGGSAGISANMLTNRVVDGFGATDTLINIEGITGTAFNDIFISGDATLEDLNTYEFYGLAGNDSITGGQTNFYFEPGSGNDTINGGDNTSSTYQISYAEYTGTNGWTVTLGGGTYTDPYGGIDTVNAAINGLRGTRNADNLTGSGANDLIRGLGGADALNGGAGVDIIRYDRDAQYGGPNGVFVLFGANPGVSGTVIDGFGFTDTIVNFETVRGTDATTSARNGSGPELFPGWSDIIITDSGANRLEGSGGQDYLDAGAGDDTIVGGDSGGAGKVDWIIGGAGTDMLDFGSETGTSGVYIAQGASSLARDTSGDYDVFFGIEIIRGTNNLFAGLEAWSDLMFGDASDTTFFGRGGADYIQAGAGADVLDGGDGVDQLYGEAGADTIIGGLGNDYMYDSGGATTYDVTGAALRSGDFDVIIGFDADDILRFSSAAQSSLSFLTIGDKHYVTAAVSGGTYTLEFQFSAVTLAQIQAQTTFL